MTTPQQRLDLDRVLKSIDAPAAIVILVSDAGELETASKGIDNDEAIFEITFSIATQLADQLFKEMPAEKQRQAALYLPTAEEAKRLGIYRARKNGK